MELTPKSMSASSPPFRSTSSHHMALNPADYPTPPYSQPQTEAISSHSPPAMGLGIMNSDVESYPQIEIYPASQQHQLQSVPRWPQECTPDSSHAYSTLSSSMSYTSSPMFADLGGLPSVSSSPYGLSSSNTGPTSSSMFLDPNIPRSGNDRRFGQFPSPYNHIPRSRPESPPKEVPRVKQESENGWPSSSDPGHGYDPSKESAALTNVTQHQGGLPSPYPMAPAYNQSNSSMLMEMNHNVKREHSSKPSQESFVSQASSAMSGSLTAVSGPPVYAPKPRRRTTPENAKQACNVCGMLFTRLSNCTAHMETHNPERKRPHKCTMAPCKKKFSRKTDLIRHVDSVHHKIKRYGCELCGQRFARGDTLRRHCMDGCKKRYRSSKSATNNPPPASMPIQQPLPVSTADLSTSFPTEQQSFSVTQFPLPDYYDNSRSYVRAGYMSNSP
ncbi:hypothetical protein FQN54_009950 [Arachnomyces sp. PD_36]|nr:hypothetical protein FQN54_009950 [Arachnomyces sp. PD_36]